jgi:hypothetical protein
MWATGVGLLVISMTTIAITVPRSRHGQEASPATIPSAAWHT